MRCVYRVEDLCVLSLGTGKISKYLDGLEHDWHVPSFVFSPRLTTSGQGPSRVAHHIPRAHVQGQGPSHGATLRPTSGRQVSYLSCWAYVLGVPVRSDAWPSPFPQPLRYHRVNPWMKKKVAMDDPSVIPRLVAIAQRCRTPIVPQQVRFSGRVSRHRSKSGYRRNR